MWNGETLAPGAHLSTASRSPSPFQGRHRFPATYVIPCNAHGCPERVELSGGQFDSVKSSLDSCQRQLTEGLSTKSLTSCVKRIRISRLDKSRVFGIMKTKGDTVTCSQAPKSYYIKIADHSSAIEWSACFCRKNEQQDRCQQDNLQRFLPHLHHLPSHEMRWDRWPDH